MYDIKCTVEGLRFSVRNCADLDMVSAWGSRSCNVVRDIACRSVSAWIGNPVTLGSTQEFGVEGL